MTALAQLLLLGIIVTVVQSWRRSPDRDRLRHEVEALTTRSAVLRFVGGLVLLIAAYDRFGRADGMDLLVVVLSAAAVFTLAPLTFLAEEGLAEAEHPAEPLGTVTAGDQVDARPADREPGTGSWAPRWRWAPGWLTSAGLPATGVPATGVPATGRRWPVRLGSRKPAAAAPER